MEQIEQRKEKAAELSSGRHANTDYAPKLTPYERKKQCSLCNVVVSHQRLNRADVILRPQNELEIKSSSKTLPQPPYIHPLSVIQVAPPQLAPLVEPDIDTSAFSNRVMF